MTKGPLSKLVFSRRARCSRQLTWCWLKDLKICLRRTGSPTLDSTHCFPFDKVHLIDQDKTPPTALPVVTATHTLLQRRCNKTSLKPARVQLKYLSLRYPLSPPLLCSDSSYSSHANSSDIFSAGIHLRFTLSTSQNKQNAN